MNIDASMYKILICSVNGAIPIKYIFFIFIFMYIDLIWAEFVNVEAVREKKKEVDRPIFRPNPVYFELKKL